MGWMLVYVCVNEKGGVFCAYLWMIDDCTILN